jgi:putative ABC transport system permease protein
MSLRDLFGFSGGALRGHRLRSGLSLLGVAIGVGSVILLTSLGEGARVFVTGEFASLGSNLIIVIPGKTETTGAMPLMGGVPRDLTLDDAEALRRQVRQIRRVAPLSIGEADARFGSRQRTITVAGTTAEFKDVRALKIGSGRYLPPGDSARGARVCVLGFKLQAELFDGRNPLGEWLRLGEDRYRVIGVMAPRGTSLGMDLDEVVHIPVSRAMKLFNRTTLFRVMLEVNSFEEIEAAKEATLALLKERHEGFEDVTVITQDSVMSTFSNILAALTAALGGIAAISLSVAGVGIMNVMLVSVSERVPEIGLLKALGATRGQILSVFLAEASILSTAGGLLGLGLGYAGGRFIIYMWPSFPVQAPLWAVIGALVLALLVGVTFGLLPARRASRLDPVAALAGR